MKNFLYFLSFLLPLQMGLNANPCLGKCEFTVEFLYLKPSVDDTYFVIDSPESSSFPMGTRKNNDFGFEPGFRIGAGYSFCGCDKKLKLNYTRLRTKSTREIAGDFLFATVGPAAFVGNFERVTGTASSELDFIYHRADATLVQKFMNCCGMNLEFQWGLEYAYLGLHEDYVYHRTTNDDILEVNQQSKAWGIGPQIGLGLNYELCQFSKICPGTLFLSIQTSGSILASQSNTSLRASLRDELQDVKDSDTWRLIPALHAHIGLNYLTCFSCFEGEFEIGYEFNSYIRGANRTCYPDDIAESLVLNNYYNFDLHGLYIAGTVRF